MKKNIGCEKNARRLAARDNWPPISRVDWPPNVGQLAASLIVANSVNDK